MRNYKELGVWQKALDLTTEVYRMTRHFPDEEKFGVTSQFRRAAVSIPANIAEGRGRGTTKEYVQFLLISRGSLMELESHGIIASRLGYLSDDESAKLKMRVEEIGRMLNGLVQSARGRKTDSRSLIPDPQSQITTY